MAEFPIGQTRVMVPDSMIGELVLGRRIPICTLWICSKARFFSFTRYISSPSPSSEMFSTQVDSDLCELMRIARIGCLGLTRSHF